MISQLTHATAAVACPPEELWEPIQTIRRRHDRQARRWMPHVTLLYPFRPAAEFAALAAPFREALRRLEPFAVTLADLRRFEHRHGSWTLWLAPEPAEPWRALHAALQALAPECDRQSRFGAGFTPHLSLAQFRGDRDAVEAFQRELQSQWRPQEFTLREVCLIARGRSPRSAFAVVERIALGGGTAAPSAGLADALLTFGFSRSSSPHPPWSVAADGQPFSHPEGPRTT